MYPRVWPPATSRGACYYRRGLADWERYVTEFPDAPDNAEMRGHLRHIRQKLSELN